MNTSYPDPPVRDEPDALALVAEYGTLARTIAGHSALWAAGACLWERKAKALWSAIAEEIRQSWSGEKAPAESRLEVQAHADVRYQRFILEGEKTAVEYHEAVARMREIEMILEVIKSINYRVGREAGLQ